MERGSGDGSLNHLTDEHWDFLTDLTYSHGFVFLRLTKTDIHPLKRMEAEPGVRLPLYSYKNEFLTPKP